MQRLLRRNAGDGPIAPYHTVPVVNLLPQRVSALSRLLSTNGDSQRDRVRVGLAVAAVLMLLLFQNFYRADNSNQSEAADLGTRFDRIVQLEDAEFALEEELALLQEAGSFPSLDFAFLTSQPESLLDAISAVFENAVPGVIVVQVQTLSEGLLVAELEVADSLALLEWRSRMSDFGAIDRVVSLDRITVEEPPRYEATLQPARGAP